MVVDLFDLGAHINLNTVYVLSFPRRVMFPSAFHLGPDGQFGEFLEGLGPSQLVGRQVLGSPVLGDMQIGLEEKQGRLEVEIIRARGLLAKSGSKLLPGERVNCKGVGRKGYQEKKMKKKIC